MTTTPTRGERNNNPFNINFISPFRAWNGQIGLEIVPPGMHFTPRFGLYDTPHHGIRAGAKQLILDNVKHGLLTLRMLIGDKTWGWAPAADSNYPVDYAQFVSTFVKIGIDDRIDLTNLPVLMPAATGFMTEENGRCLYPQSLIEAACRDALGLPQGVTA